MRQLTAGIVASVLAFVGAGQASGTTVSSTFDGGLDGWYSNTPAEINWDPGGYVRFVDGSAASTGSGAPPKFLGDWSHLDGIGVLSYDHRVFQVGGGNPAPLWGVLGVQIWGPAGDATFVEDHPLSGGPPTATGWITAEVPIDESHWTIDNGTWGAILSNVTEMGILIERIHNVGVPSEEVSGIDNVHLIPEPSSLIILVMGAIAPIAYALRRRKRAAWDAN